MTGFHMTNGRKANGRGGGDDDDDDDDDGGGDGRKGESVLRRGDSKRTSRRAVSEAQQREWRNSGE